MIPGIFAGAANGEGGAGPPAPVTWNPADKSARITLSNGNLTATKTDVTDVWSSVRATAGKATGKFYWEVVVELGGGTGPDMIVGVADTSMNIENYAGQDTHGLGIYARDGKKVTGGSFSTYGAHFGVGTVIGHAWDVDAQKLWFSIDGDYPASGDPASGANPAFTAVPTGMFACASIYNAGSIQAWTARFRASEFTGTPPSGFNPYDPL